MTQTERAFHVFDAANPKVWELYQQFCWGAINRGKRKIGSKAMIERIRWEIWFTTDSSDGFKINNNFTPYYARKWNRENPAEIQFELRRLRGEDGENGELDIDMP